MNGDSFSRFEDQIQRLVEGGFARLFTGTLHPRELVNRLSRAMEDNATSGPDGEMQAPDVYVLRLNPRDHRTILENGEDVIERLAGELVEMARISGLKLSRVPEVRLLADASVRAHSVSASAQHTTSRRDTTQAMPLNSLKADAEHANSPSAVLIVNGDQQVPLDKAVVNLGRQRDNDIIIDDPTVSRHHAQIRLRFGSYVLFDLGSRGGTTVNGNTIQEKVLQSGDVIGLAHSSSLLYLEDGVPDEDSMDPLDDTQAYPPSKL